MKLALLGAGQLGGSLALALKERDGDIEIVAYDIAPENTEYLYARGAVDRVAVSPVEAVIGADIVVLATPVSTYRSLAKQIAPTVAEGAVITDLGSVKHSMLALVPMLPHAHIVAAHPIAGSEQSGARIARSDLFRNRLCILTPDEATNAHAQEIVQTLWQSVGADVIAMPAGLHDQIYAYVSHLPHYIAFITAAYLHRIGAEMDPSDTILQQFLRISRSNARMWADIAMENREALLPVIATYIALLEHFRTELRAGDKAESPDSVAVAKTLLPRILAACLISSVSLYEKQSGTSLRPFGAGGMRDMVAPAAHTPEGDTEAISHASQSVADHLDGIIPLFRQLESRIGAADATGMLATIEQMVEEAFLLSCRRN